MTWHRAPSPTPPTFSHPTFKEKGDDDDGDDAYDWNFFFACSTITRYCEQYCRGGDITLFAQTFVFIQPNDPCRIAGCDDNDDDDFDDDDRDKDDDSDDDDDDDEDRSILEGCLGQG